jgi:predicted aspartyl protease
VIGAVDSNGRAIISIDVATEESLEAIPTDAWIDTAFTGELVLPKANVDELSLGVAASVETILADGQQAMVPTYRCWIDWRCSARNRSHCDGRRDPIAWRRSADRP